MLGKGPASLFCRWIFKFSHWLILSKIIWPYIGGLISGLYSIPLICTFYLYTNNSVFSLMWFCITVSFEIGKCWVLQYWYSFSLKNFFSNWQCWVFMGYTWVFSSCGEWVLWFCCVGFSLQWFHLLWSMGSRVHGLQ